MDDGEIIRLFRERDERALQVCGERYGAFCRRIAENILPAEDAEECVNDTFLTAWLRIPPDEPASLKAYLGKICRNHALSRWRTNHSLKRYAGVQLLLDELDDCVPSDFDVETHVEGKLLHERIEAWLDSLPREDRILFVRRYYFGDSVKALATAHGCSAARMTQRMLRLRRGLKAELERTMEHES